MHVCDQHNHHSQPQLLDVIPHTLEVIVFPRLFMWFLIYGFLLYFLIFLLPGDRSVRFETFKERRPSLRRADLTIQIIENFHMGHLCFCGIAR